MATVQRPRRQQPLVQKILIPSGLVKANETVVIEVPSNLKRHAVVVATRPSKSGRDQADGMGDEAFPRYPCTFAGEAAPAYREAYKEAESPQDGDYAEDDSLIYDVDEAEKAEREMLFRNLQAFHRARRNVLEGTKNMLSKSMPSEIIAAPNEVEDDGTYYADIVDDDAEAEYADYRCASECPQQPQPAMNVRASQQMALQQERLQQHTLQVPQTNYMQYDYPRKFAQAMGMRIHKTEPI